MNKYFTGFSTYGEDEFPASNDVALQSYPIYCSKKTLERESEFSYFGDPFCTTSCDEMPFLSLIQIHITPEIFVHLKVEEECQNVVSIFENDIHELLEHFVTKYPDCQMVCRVYQLLSTGDFTVAIRSADAATSFKISTLLRKRAVSIEGSEFSRLVLYKTYTLLTIDSQIVGITNESGKADNFVIRCCYSNKYWAQWREAREFSDKHFSNGMKEISRLNGRYDFSIQLSQSEFEQLFPVIWELKNGKTESEKSRIDVFKESELEGEIGKADFLKYLIKKNYLSYVNERYLLNEDSFENQPEDEGEYSLSDFGKAEIGVSLYNRNCQKLESVRGKYRKLSARLNDINCYRKNMMYHFLLLGKLINLSQVVNSISDTRIHTSTLLEQSSIVLQSMNYYLDIYEATGDSVIIDLIEAYLREAVCAQDSFARYIRNNNLQSLQTPNYNIESTTSMEKILIGYSEFVRLFLGYYLRSDVSKKVELYVGDKKKYFPIVISKLPREDLSVEVVFPEGKSISWNTEKNIQNKSEYNAHTYLVIITCPTIRELGNLPNMLTSLYHEIAHQFRYKDRKERNKIMLRYALSAAFEVVAEEIVNRFKFEKGGRDAEARLTKAFRDTFVKTYMHLLYCRDSNEGDTIEDILNSFSHEYEEAPLNTFRDRISKDFKIFMDDWKKDWESKSYAEDYIQSLTKYLNLTDENVKQNISDFYDSFEKLKGLLKNEFSSESNADEERVRGELNIIAVRLLQAVGSKEQPDISSGSESPDKPENNIRKMEKLLLKLAKEKADVYESYVAFVYGLEKFVNIQHSIAGKGRKEKFLKITYRSMCNEWEKLSDEMRRNKVSSSEFNVWEAAGRYYGIDCETEENHKIYKRIIDKNMTSDIPDAVYYINSRINFYREEASDLFMTAFLPLTPFGYLNLMASNIPSDSGISEEHARRIIRVLTVRWINAPEKTRPQLPQAIREFYENCKKIFATLSDFRSAIWSKYNCNDIWENEYLKYRGTFSSSFSSDINCLTEELNHKAEILEKTSLSVLASDKVFRAIVLEGRQEIKKLYETDYLLDDFRAGVEVLKEIPPLSESRDDVMENLEMLNREIAELLNQPQNYYNDVSKYAAINEKSITFLMKAYYRNKLCEARYNEGAEYD